MTDQEMGEKEVEQTTQESPTLEAEETQLEDQQQPVEAETTAEDQETDTEETNDEQPPKENAAWAKMRVENKQLKQQVQQQPQIDEGYLQDLQGFTNQANTYHQDLQFSENTGIDEVTQAINAANRAAKESSARVRQLEIQLEEQEMFNSFPHFKQDKLAQQLIAEKKLAASFTGRERRYVDIAREVDSLLRKNREQVEAETRETEQKKFVQKQAATTQTQGTTTGGGQQTDLEDLRMRARRGDRHAQEEILKRKVNLSF